MATKEQPQPPIDIEGIAKSLGLEIAYEPMLCNGYLEEIDENKYVIKVNKRSSKQRQRFTITHELTHLVINLGGLYKIMSILKDILPEEERFVHNSHNQEKICNFISGSLLIPPSPVKQLSDWTHLSIRKVEEVSKEWDISKDVLLWRVITTASYEGGFIWGKTDSNPSNPQEINMRSCWGVFPKSHKIKVPKEMHLGASGYSLVDFTENKEKFNRVAFDFEGLRGLRTICAKAYGRGPERRILIIVYPREVESDLNFSTRSVKQATLPS